MIPDYCTQNNGQCWTCSLANYGRDCRNKSIAAREMGSIKSERKAASSRANGRLAPPPPPPPRKPRCPECEGKVRRCAACRAKSQQGGD